MSSHFKPVGKALIYATSARRLLVFEEPDFPEVPLQVPGGTIEDGELPEATARREFHEETGLPQPNELIFLGCDNCQFTWQNDQYLHRRHYFHLPLSDDMPLTWDHHEIHAFDGAAPILFRFFWLDLEEAKILTCSPICLRL